MEIITKKICLEDFISRVPSLLPCVEVHGDVNDYEEKLQLKSKNKNRAYNNILNDSKRIKTNTISGGNVSSGGKFPTFGSVGNNSGGVYYFEMGGNVCQGKKSLMNNMNYYYENL
jgi:hypothetical protein